MNIWHDLSPEQVKPENFTAVIEISKGSKVKYELDKETGLLRMDRVLYTATHYPQNYGFIPRTYGEDNDPLDVLVLCSESILPLTMVQCYPIGVIQMVDNGSGDEKIIAIPFSDPTYSGYQSIDDLPRHVFNEMEHFSRCISSWSTSRPRSTRSWAGRGRWRSSPRPWSAIGKNSESEKNPGACLAAANGSAPQNGAPVKPVG